MPNKKRTTETNLSSELERRKILIEKIETYRLDAGLSYEELAPQLGIDSMTFLRFRMRPKPLKANRFIAFGVSLKTSMEEGASVWRNSLSWSSHHLAKRASAWASITCSIAARSCFLRFAAWFNLLNSYSCTTEREESRRNLKGTSTYLPTFPRGRNTLPHIATGNQ